MNEYFCTNFTGHWPVPVATITRADTPEQAMDNINSQLRKCGLVGDAKLEDIQPWIKDIETIVLSDGNY
jgi:hypothetical protein